MEHNAEKTPHLVRRAQAGDRQAFEQIVTTHYDLMLGFALKFSGNRSDAEDITQQACMKLARGIRQYRFEAAFPTWVYRLVLNCCHDYYRYRHEDDRQVPDIDVPDGNEARVLLRQVLEQVDKLGQGFRETLSLVIGQGLTHREAAEILGIKESTVSWRLHELRKQLDPIIYPESFNE